MKRLAAGVLAIVVATLSACVGNDEPIDVVTPSPLSTPTPTVSPFAQSDVSLAIRDYEETYATFRRLAENGGAAEPSAELRAMATGPFLESASLVLQTLHENRYRLTTGSRVWVESGDVQGDGSVRLRACEDLTQSDYVDQAGQVAIAMDSKRFEQIVTMETGPDRWVVATADSRKLSSWSESEWCR